MEEPFCYISFGFFHTILNILFQNLSLLKFKLKQFIVSLFDKR